MPPKDSEHSTPPWHGEMLEQLAQVNRSCEKVLVRVETMEQRSNERHEQLRLQLDTMNKLITGNGHPERGVLFRLARTEEQLENQDERLENQSKRLEDLKPVSGRIKSLENREKLRKKILLATLTIMAPGVAWALWVGFKALVTQAG